MALAAIGRNVFIGSHKMKTAKAINLGCLHVFFIEQQLDSYYKQA
jgi:hypothetical protein